MTPTRFIATISDMSYINYALRKQKVLVTGATGFVGGRLALRLATEEEAIVTGTGRSLEKAAYLQAAGVNMQAADMLDTARLAELVAEQDVVFHVAAWLVYNKGAEAMAYKVNVEATEQLLRLAAKAGVRRFVYVSSMAAYGLPKTTTVTEETPLDTTQADVYGRTKALADNRVLELGRELGIEVAVIRPGMIYGPGSVSWSVQMLRLVQNGTPCIVGDGSGHAYPSFIDNMVDGLLLTAVSPQAPNHAFQLIDSHVSFKTFFGCYGRMCGKTPRSMPLWGAKIVAWLRDTFNLRVPLTRERVRFMTLHTLYPGTKARTLLGYTPRIGLDEGMAQAEAWLRSEGYLAK